MTSMIDRGRVLYANPRSDRGSLLRPVLLLGVLGVLSALGGHWFTTAMLTILTLAVAVDWIVCNGRPNDHPIRAELLAVFAAVFGATALWHILVGSSWWIAGFFTLVSIGLLGWTRCSKRCA